MASSLCGRAGATVARTSRGVRVLCLSSTGSNSTLSRAVQTRGLSTIGTVRQQEAAPAPKPATTTPPGFRSVTYQPYQPNQSNQPHKTAKEQAASRNAVPTTRNMAAASPASSPLPTPPHLTPHSAPPSAIPSATASTPHASKLSEPLESSFPTEALTDLSEGLSDGPSLPETSQTSHVDWSQSFHGLSSAPFSAEASQVLTQPIRVEDIEIKPEGIIYLPEIKYRRILNAAFGPGGWGLAPRGETIVTKTAVTREYALVVGGRLVSIARGEQDYFSPDGIPTATEGCKSNALMRCCKDLGVASELWDPRYIRKYLAEWAKEVWVEHVVSKKRKKINMRKDDEVRYPFKEVK